jgi:hypothetical protein
MTKALKPRILSKDQARAEARRINDQGVAEPLVTQSLLCEQTLWDELLKTLNARGTNISREFRRWADREVKRS